MKRLDVVIPVYNEHSGLLTLHQRLIAVLERLDYEWRVVYADDGSTDGSDDIIADLVATDARVGAVHLSRNFGQQTAIAAGLSVADADAVVLMDADLEDPPEVIPRLVERWEAGCDVVYVCKQNERQGPVRRALVALFYRLMRVLSDVPIPANAGNFSLMDRAVVRVINRMPERSRYLAGLRAFVGGRQGGVDVVRDVRYDGNPRMVARKLLRMAGDALFAFSDIPLRLATYLGFAVSVVGFALIGMVLWKKLVSGEAILGWASMMVSVLFLGGIQLLGLGIVGEYVARIYRETKARPGWVVARYRNVEATAPAPGGVTLGDGGIPD